MAKFKASTSFENIFNVELKATESNDHPNVVRFRLDAENGSNAQVSFDDGATWVSADVVYHSMKSFEDRFPEAFGGI